MDQGKIRDRSLPKNEFYKNTGEEQMPCFDSKQKCKELDHDSFTSFDSLISECQDQYIQERKSLMAGVEACTGNSDSEDCKNYYEIIEDNAKDKNVGDEHRQEANKFQEYSLYSDCGCLVIESGVTNKNSSPRGSLQHINFSLNHSYCQSQIHLPENESWKLLCTSKESIHVYKIEKLRERMMKTLNDINHHINYTEKPDGIEDLRRRQQRAAEFSSRFCRNYLYQLHRHNCEIRKLFKNIACNPGQGSYHLILCQKLVTAHQKTLQALQAYLNHLPCSVEGGLPDKLMELLHLVKDLCGFCSKLGIVNQGGASETTDVVRDKCTDLLLQIQNAAECEEDIYSSTTSLSLHGKFKPGRKTFREKKAINYDKSLMKSKTVFRQKCAHPCRGYSHAKLGVSNPNGPLKSKLRVKSAPESNPQPNKISEEIPQRKRNFKEVYIHDEDIPTMMESFPLERKCHDVLAPWYSAKLNQTYYKRTAQKNAQEDTLKPDMNVLKTIEGDIKNIQKDMTVLRDKNHPNYSNYKQILEKLHNCLSNMKASKCAANKKDFEGDPKHSSSKVACNLKGLKHDNEGPKNVKLICLPPADDESKSEKCSTNTSMNQHYASRSARKEIEGRENSLYITSTYQGSEYSDEENPHLPKFTTEMSINKPSEETTLEQVSSKWEPQTVGKLCELRDGEIIHLNHVSWPNVKNSQSCELYKRSIDKKHRNTPNTDSHTEVDELSKNTFTQGDITSRPLCLSVSKNENSSFLLYQKTYCNIMSGKALYNEAKKPWLMLSRLADLLVYNALREVVNDIGICNITTGLLELEFM